MRMNLCVVLGLLVCCALSYGQMSCDQARVAFATDNSDCLMAFESAGAFVALGTAGSAPALNENQTNLLCANATCQTAYMQYAAACQSNISVSELIMNVRTVRRSE